MDAARSVEALVHHIDLNSQKIGRCSVCGDGYGTCRSEHRCQVLDDFQELHESLVGTDLFVVITPVYFWDMSEPSKAFFDRLRRCEAWKKDDSLFAGKPVVAVAAAGGSGNGTVYCLETMDRLFKHMNASVFDLIPITRKTREYQLSAIASAVTAAVNWIKHQP